MTAFVRVRRFCLTVLITIAAFAAVSTPARASVIGFEAIDLVDAVTGEDLWEYRYFVSERSFEADQGFSVYFDTLLFANLLIPAIPLNTDWDILAVQPDPALPDAGFYDALALVDAASLANPFVVSFTWLGGAAGPGSQLFTVNQFDAAGHISFLETGVTVPQMQSVPEPSSLLLVSMACVAVVLGHRRLTRRRL